MSNRHRFCTSTAAALILVSLACESNTFPKATKEVRIEEGRFFPKDPEILAGSTVRWVNVLPKGPDNVRTVTSGSPGDSTAGSLFDETLEGRAPGETEGGAFVYRFGERGVFPYFSRNPESPVISGTVTVR